MTNSSDPKQKKREPQRKAFNFLVAHLRSQDTFTQDDFKRATGWEGKTFSTYWSKQLKAFVEPVRGDRYQVRETFRPYITWRRFQQHVTQVRRVVSDYSAVVYDNVLIYEFYMPLTNEAHLRTTLDALFFSDIILAKLRAIGVQQLNTFFKQTSGETEDSYFQGILGFIEQMFVGYSIFHVNGRFRAAKLANQDGVAEILKRGDRYLIDETTAVTRFIFPCKDSEGADKVRFLFERLFVRSIIQLINGEEEIWMVESGSRNRVHIWRVAEDEGLLFE